MASLSLRPGKASPGCPRLSETGRRPAELAAASKTLRVSSHARTVLGRNPGCFGFVSAGSKAWPFTPPVLGGTIKRHSSRACGSRWIPDHRCNCSVRDDDCCARAGSFEDDGRGLNRLAYTHSKDG